MLSAAIKLIRGQKQNQDSRFKLIPSNSTPCQWAMKTRNLYDEVIELLHNEYPDKNSEVIAKHSVEAMKSYLQNDLGINIYKNKAEGNPKNSNFSEGVEIICGYEFRAVEKNKSVEIVPLDIESEEFDELCCRKTSALTEEEQAVYVEQYNSLFDKNFQFKNEMLDSNGNDTETQKIQRVREAIKRVDKDIKDKFNNSIDYDNEKVSADDSDEGFEITSMLEKLKIEEK